MMRVGKYVWEGRLSWDCNRATVSPPILETLFFQKAKNLLLHIFFRNLKKKKKTAKKFKMWELLPFGSRE